MRQENNQLLSVIVFVAVVLVFTTVVSTLSAVTTASNGLIRFY